VSATRQAPASRELRRGIGVTTAAAVVVANMIGSGIFTTSGFVARDVGSPVWLMGLWLAGGAIALAGTLCYAELGAALPQAGGEYVYLREAYGPLAAFLSGWTSLLVGFSGAIAAALIATVDYLRPYLPQLADPIAARAAAVAMLWAITIVHISGLRAGGIVQRVLTGATIAAIAGLVIAAFAMGHGSAVIAQTAAPAHGSAAVSLIFILFAYSGWNAAAYLGGEIDHPQRNLPRALILGTAVVTLLYLAMNAFYLYALGVPAMSGVVNVAEKAASAALGPRVGAVTSAMIALCIVGSASAMILAGPRVCYAMARDDILPRGLSAVHPSFGTPGRAMLLQAAWATALVIFFGTFERLVIYTGFAVTLFSALAVAAVIVLRMRRPAMERPFTVPLYPWIPAAYIAASIWILAYTVAGRPLETALGAFTIAAALPLYWFRRARAERIRSLSF
jgi:APA family basic amino acid/polyamine antiporter